MLIWANKPWPKFETWLRNRKYADSTIEKFWYWFRLYYRHNINKQINSENIERFIEYHNNMGARAFIKAFLKFYRVKKIDYEVPKILGRKKKRELKSKVLSEGEIEYLIRRLKDGRDQLIVMLMYEGGLRVSEVINIRVTDLDFDTGRVTVIGKGDKQRTVRFSERTKSILEGFVIGLNPQDKLFPKRSRQTVWRKLNALKDEFRAHMLHPHMLRHSCASKMIRNKVGIKIIGDYLGHESITTTEMYTHLDTEHIDEAWEKTFETDVCPQPVIKEPDQVVPPSRLESLRKRLQTKLKQKK